MTDIRSALVRKFGPLPAWAWAVILGGALYLYRRNAALRAGTLTAPNTNATSPSVSTDTTPQEPVTLQPGESAYDPNTGQLVSTSPEQQPSGDPMDPTGWGMGDRMPVTLQPGESIYDPGTGKVLPGQAESPTEAPGPGPAKKKKRITKRTKKPKTQHHKSNVVKRSTKHTKPRGTGKLRVSLHTKHKQPARPKRRVRTHADAMPPTRARTPASSETQPAMRQRPAAPRVIDHTSQRTAPHPARPAPAHHEPPKKRRRGRRV